MRRRRENYGEKRRQAERDRARMNRQRQREQQQNNDLMTAGGVRTTIAMHCGLKIFKMAAKVEVICFIFQ